MLIRGLDLDRLFKAPYRSGQIASLALNHPEIVPGFRVTWVDLDGKLEFAYGSRGIVRLVQQQSLPVVSRGLTAIWDRLGAGGQRAQQPHSKQCQQAIVERSSHRA